MRAKRSIAIGGVAASLLGGGAALAARNGDEGAKQEDAVLSDAAKRLGVSADELESALAKAQDGQLDKAVKAGKLTQERADAIKRWRRSSGRVLGGPGGPHHGPGLGHPGPPGFGGPGGVLDAVAGELGISVESLLTELHDGKTLAQLAKAHDKTVDGLEGAAEKVLSKRLDAAVEQGHLTRTEADRILERLPDLIDHLGDRGPERRHGFGPPPGGREGFGPPPRWQ
jgi:uncharacterized protein YidB (DUF937 family)